MYYWMKTSKAKLADFGTLKQRARTDLNEPTHTLAGIDSAGTTLWMAPEIISGNKTTKASDVYSYGMLLWQLGACEVQFSKATMFEVTKMIVKGEHPKIHASTPKQMAKLIKMCWDKTPTNRPPAAEVVSKLNEEKPTLSFK